MNFKLFLHSKQQSFSLIKQVFIKYNSNIDFQCSKGEETEQILTTCENTLPLLPNHIYYLSWTWKRNNPTNRKSPFPHRFKKQSRFKWGRRLTGLLSWTHMIYVSWLLIRNSILGSFTEKSQNVCMLITELNFSLPHSM